ncbi:MAG: hypothetical protein K2K73_00235 [Ureaplasma sp.]|nr:hypothetical protein [Ureaplasma sp.]
MVENLKSKIKNKKPIDWTHTIVISDLAVDQNILKMHEERVNNIFASLSDLEKQQQVTNIIIRDNLFNKAMDFIISHYEIEIDPSDIEMLKVNLKNAFPQAQENVLNDIASKLIQKLLIFKDIQTEFNIDVSDEELISVLKDYYEKTNKPIRDFMQDEKSFQAAKNTLLEEKTTSFIIEKFPRDLEELKKKLNKYVDDELAK